MNVMFDVIIRFVVIVFVYLTGFMCGLLARKD